ncbi:hypothetical protein [Gemmatimonas sp.]|jgi:hypothetical protein|uniref:hypothetical protein n=1 Tax=Gemmatimonas sp. TaxID=1962908 RepID=UPI0037BFC043
MKAAEALEVIRSNPELAEQSKEQMQALMSRAATDRTFRTQLLTAPRAALAEFMGVSEASLPAGYDVRFVENTVDATIVLPDLVDDAAELSERDLEAVAGGSDPVSLTIIITLIAIDTALITKIVLDSHAKH